MKNGKNTLLFSQAYIPLELKFWYLFEDYILLKEFDVWLIHVLLMSENYQVGLMHVGTPFN